MGASPGTCRNVEAPKFNMISSTEINWLASCASTAPVMWRASNVWPQQCAADMVRHYA